MDKGSKNVQKRIETKDTNTYPYLRVDPSILTEARKIQGWTENPVSTSEINRNNQIVADIIHQQSKLHIVNFYNNAGYNPATQTGGRGNYLMPFATQTGAVTDPLAKAPEPEQNLNWGS